MQFKIPVPTLIAVGLTLLSPAAHALLLAGGAVAFTSSAVVTDSEGGGATPLGGSLGSTDLARFDSALGVLTGASLDLISTRTQYLQVKSTDGPNSGQTGTVTSTGQASGSISLVRPTGNTTVASISIAASCTGSRTAACNGGIVATSVPVNMKVSIPSAALDLYAGAGTIAIGQSVSGAVTQQSNAFTGTETSRYQLDWSGTLAIDYSYLLHAAPSFDAGAALTELTLDFGTVTVGDAAALSFGMFNLAGERAGLDLDSIVGSGDASVLGVNTGLFDGLEAGNGGEWSALLDTSVAGSFSASYTFFFSDADIGAASTRATRQMTLNLLANVIEPRAAAVPEPGSLPLLLGSLGVLAATLRRRQI